MSLMPPVPLLLQVDPGEAVQVHAAPSKAGGGRSTTVAPVTASGPAFDAVMVYVIGWPGAALV